MQQPATGALPSPLDYRDEIASAGARAAAGAPAISLPSTFHTELGGILDQNKEPDCVLFSVVKLMKLYWFVKTGKWIDLSPRFLAILVKRYDHQDRATGGTYPRLALKLAVQYGCCTTALLPNDSSLPVLTYRKDSLLTDAMFAEAAQYKIPGYVKVPIDFTITREYVKLYGAVSALLQVGAELWTPSWAKTDIDPMRTPAQIESGHEMTITGWLNPTLNEIENQWSEDWADKGRNQYDPLAWRPFLIEQWAVAEIPADVSSYLKLLPAPADFHYQWNTNLHQGETSEDIKFAQVALMILGILSPIPADQLGIYGPKTAAAVLNYQLSIGVAPGDTNPGAIGPLTRAGLNKQFTIDFNV